MIAKFMTWYYDVGNILKSFERTQRRLSNAAAHHTEQAGVHIMAISKHEQARTSHLDQAARAIAVREKIAALIA